MQCPYCSEDIKDEAIFCKHCHQVLSLTKPLVAQNQELAAKVTQLDAELTQLRAELAERQAAKLEIGKHAPAVSAYWVAFSARYVVLPVALLLLAHYLIVIKLDLNLVYLRMASIAIPLPFGFAMFRRGHEGTSAAVTAATVSCAVGILAVVGMSMVTHILYGYPVVPATVRDWQEDVEYALSMALAMITGYVLATVLRPTKPLPAAAVHQGNSFTLWLAPMVGMLGGGKTFTAQMDTIERIMRIATMTAAAAGSVYTGLKALFS